MCILPNRRIVIWHGGWWIIAFCVLCFKPFLSVWIVEELHYSTSLTLRAFAWRPTLCPLQRYENLFTFTLVRDSAWFTGVGLVTGALTFQSILMLNRYFCVRWASSLKLFKVKSTFNCQAHKIGLIILSAGCNQTWNYIVCR